MKINFIIDSRYVDRIHDTKSWIETACQDDIDYDLYDETFKDDTLKYSYIILRQGYPSHDIKSNDFEFGK